MPELLNCEHCGHRVSSDMAKKIGGIVACPSCVPLLKAAEREEAN